MKRDIVNIRKTIQSIIESGSICDMEKLSEILEDSILDGKNSFKYQLKLYSMANGYHFNEHTLLEALELIGGVKLKCNEIESTLKKYGIQRTPEVNIYDVSYAVHMIYSDLSDLDLSEQTIFRMAVAYCQDIDFPIRYGRCFVEWFNKVSLMNH